MFAEKKRKNKIKIYIQKQTKKIKEKNTFTNKF